MHPAREEISVDTPCLAVHCERSGPGDGYPCLRLHGWPDDARTWDRVLPALHLARLRTIVPFLRGCGPTRFRSAAAVAQHLVRFLAPADGGRLRSAAAPPR